MPYKSLINNNCLVRFAGHIDFIFCVGVFLGHPLKPLHASWVCELYNYLTSSEGKPINENGWRRAGITSAVENGYASLPPLDPFESLDPMLTETNCTPSLSDETLLAVCNIDGEDVLNGYSRVENSDDDDDGSDWYHSDFEKNTFEIFDDIFDDEA